MNKDYDHIREYFSEEIEVELRGIISDFAILWNRYENAFSGGLTENKQIEDEVIIKIKEIDKDIIESKIKEAFKNFKQYFEKRYKERFNKDEFDCLNHHFHISYKFKRKYYSNDIYDNLYFMLGLVKRVRNNMFHGTKELKDLNEQTQLFILSNNLLSFVMRHARPDDYILKWR